MGNLKIILYQLLLLALFCAAVLPQDVRGSRVQTAINSHHTVNFKKGSKGSLIGSSAPSCSYNECRRCKHKCRAEQVPVEANDPINTAYYYKCICLKV